MKPIQEISIPSKHTGTKLATIMTRRPADADTVTAERTVVSDDGAFTPDDLGERDGVETSVSADGSQRYTATGREHGRPTGNPYQAAEHKEREKERRRGKQYQDSRDSYHEYQRKRWDIPEEVYESGEAEQRESDKESRRNGYRRDAQEQFGYTDTQVHADLPWPGNDTERRPQRPASDTTPAHRPDVDSKQLPPVKQELKRMWQTFQASIQIPPELVAGSRVEWSLINILGNEYQSAGCS